MFNRRGSVNSAGCYRWTKLNMCSSLEGCACYIWFWHARGLGCVQFNFSIYSVTLFYFIFLFIHSFIYCSFFSSYVISFVYFLIFFILLLLLGSLSISSSSSSFYFTFSRKERTLNIFNMRLCLIYYLYHVFL